MSVAKISYPTNAYQTNNHQKRAGELRHDFRRLLKSIQDGNLAGAQQAYAIITHTLPDIFQSLSSQLTKDYKAIGYALAKDDLSGARYAVVKLQQDLLSIGRSRNQHRFDSDIDGARNSRATSNNLFSLYNENIELPTIGTNIDIKI